MKRSFNAIFGLACCFSSAFLFAAEQPNLLIIHTDEHNFRTLGCYRDQLPREQALMWGDAVVETPHVDKIAAEGAICTSFYATTPVCSPSRATFVTGRYPHNTPVNTNNIPMADDVITFAEVLRKQGYATGYAGKWHLDGSGKPQWAPERKFGFEDNRYMFNRGHWKQLEIAEEGPQVKARDKKGKPSYSVDGADEKSFTTDFLADRTIEFVRENKDKPFAYMISLPDPHGPDSVRPPYDTMFAHQKYEVPRTFERPQESIPNWGADAGKFSPMAKYYGMVKCIDDNVGRILDVLRSENLMDNTIVVFTSDHGDLRGEHHRQNKGVPYEASAKIPFVIRYKGKIAPGTVIDEALGCVDFSATILRLMGFAPTGQEEGRDASQLFLTGKAPESWKDVSILRATGDGTRGGWLAAVTKRYKLVLSANDQPWLFDLAEDPDELVNRFGDPALRETIRFLARELVQYGKDAKDPRANDPQIASDLAWAAEGEGDYVPAPRSQPKGKKGKKAKKQ